MLSKKTFLVIFKIVTKIWSGIQARALKFYFFDKLLKRFSDLGIGLNLYCKFFVFFSLEHILYELPQALLRCRRKEKMLFMIRTFELTLFLLTSILISMLIRKKKVAFIIC